jgi:hypothetical protein
MQIWNTIPKQLANHLSHLNILESMRVNNLVG